MKAGEVFFRGDYATLLAEGTEDLPDEAKNGPYRLGAVLMVHRDSMSEDYRLPDIAEWFPARVCLPPSVPGQWYRWYDPFIWFETDGPIHTRTDAAPENVSTTGKVWSDYYRDSLDRWAYPIEEWRRLFS